VKHESLTSRWRELTKQRAEDWLAKKEAHVARHGADIFQRLSYFYNTIVDLLAGGNVGGIRILAQKPLALPAVDPVSLLHLHARSTAGPKLSRQSTV